MMTGRDAKGRFVPARAYRLRFDDGSIETIRAHTAPAAVAKRVNAQLPQTIVDLTAMAAFARGDRRPVERMPLRRLVRGHDWGKR